MVSQIHCPSNGKTGMTKGIIMSKAAFVILASGDSPESLGRPQHAARIVAEFYSIGGLGSAFIEFCPWAEI
jgi:hypothetical protein